MPRRHRVTLRPIPTVIEGLLPRHVYASGQSRRCTTLTATALPHAAVSRACPTVQITCAIRAWRFIWPCWFGMRTDRKPKRTGQSRRHWQNMRPDALVPSSKLEIRPVCLESGPLHPHALRCCMSRRALSQAVTSPGGEPIYPEQI